METNYLVLVRHGQSAWNQKIYLLVGRTGLTELGKEEAFKAGQHIKKQNIKFNLLFCIKKSIRYSFDNFRSN